MSATAMPAVGVWAPRPQRVPDGIDHALTAALPCVVALMVGVVLFVVCGVTQVPMRGRVRSAWPFIALVQGVLVPCLLLPPIVTALPRAPGP